MKRTSFAGQKEEGKYSTVLSEDPFVQLIFGSADVFYEQITCIL